MLKYPSSHLTLIVTLYMVFIRPTFKEKTDSQNIYMTLLNKGLLNWYHK